MSSVWQPMAGGCVGCCCFVVGGGGRLGPTDVAWRYFVAVLRVVKCMYIIIVYSGVLCGACWCWEGVGKVLEGVEKRVQRAWAGKAVVLQARVIALLLPA
jgi:hypothetical protein